MHCRSGDVYKPTRLANPVLNPCARRNERVKAQVLPFPFVPATWMMFRLSTSLSCISSKNTFLPAQIVSLTEWPSRRSQSFIPTKLGMPFNGGFTVGVDAPWGIVGGRAGVFGRAFRLRVSRSFNAFCSMVRVDFLHLVGVLPRSYASYWQPWILCPGWRLMPVEQQRSGMHVTDLHLQMNN